MKRYSKVGKQSASPTRLLNWLVAFVVMGAMGFATIPSLLLLNGRPATEASYFTSRVEAGSKLATKEDAKGGKAESRNTSSEISVASGVTKEAVPGGVAKEVEFKTPSGEIFAQST